MKCLSNSIWQELVFPIFSQYNLTSFVYVLLLVWYAIILSWLLYLLILLPALFSPYCFYMVTSTPPLWVHVPEQVIVTWPIHATCTLISLVCQGSCTFSSLVCTWDISCSKFSLWFHHKFPPFQRRNLFFVPYGTCNFTCLVTGCPNWIWPMYHTNITLVSTLTWAAHLFLPLVVYMVT
jgi:hypothetical protein